MPACSSDKVSIEMEMSMKKVHPQCHPNRPTTEHRPPRWQAGDYPRWAIARPSDSLTTEGALLPNGPHIAETGLIIEVPTLRQ